MAPRAPLRYLGAGPVAAGAAGGANLVASTPWLICTSVKTAARNFVRATPTVIGSPTRSRTSRSITGTARGH